MEIYSALLPIHNILRWVVLVAAVAAIGFAWHGVISKREWSRGDRLRTVAYVASMHTQLLLGILLYVQSPTVSQALEDMGEAMGQTSLRFWAVEHISMMILAVVVVQVGSIMAKRADDDATKHKRSAIFFTLGLVLVLGGLHYTWSGRPLIRGF